MLDRNSCKSGWMAPDCPIMVRFSMLFLARNRNSAAAFVWAELELDLRSFTSCSMSEDVVISFGEESSGRETVLG